MRPRRKLARPRHRKPAMNPLLVFPDLPRFDAFSPHQVAPALEELIERARAALAKATDPETPLEWESLVTPLEDATEQLGRAWGTVSHLNSVADSPELRAAYNAELPRVVKFWTELGQDQRLFARYQGLRDSEGFAALSPERQRVVEHALRDFRLGGAELVSPARERFAAIQERAAELSQRFSENVLDATNAFALPIEDEQELAGIPDDARETARAEAERRGVQGYVLTLQQPAVLAVLQYAEQRSLRESIYRANATRASVDAQAPAAEEERAALDNAPVIDEILALRAEEAGLLGYPNFAEVSLAPKMAGSAGEVVIFLRDLGHRARPFAERDFAELKAFAAAELGMAELCAWDIPFASEKLRESRYAYSGQEVRRYFQLPRVLGGLFALVERLFGVSVKPDQASVWHEDVSFYRIERDGVLVGQFYLDPYSRGDKRPGAWMDDARARRRTGATLQTPVAYLTCNFQAPSQGRPALLTHDEVTTLFHEFGHGLHHMLTRIDELAIAGISGVEWDAVELPSQFLENFCWEWQIVSEMSAHIDTGEALPRALFERMLAAKNFQSGLQTLRQVEFALFDMLLHSQFTPGAAKSVQQLLDEVRSEVAVVTPPAFNRFQNSFAHIFGGGYAAGYYSYKWAEVLSADAYASFEEAAEQADGERMVAETGQLFLREILSVGGSRPAIDSFRAFRG
ncbi:MAG: M3 family metallopeptidase, partial [Burkholderiaceae bacterium]|nr:M3 family metallopeptidase [Burkholderiaceae bacterium]